VAESRIISPERVVDGMGLQRSEADMSALEFEWRNPRGERRSRIRHLPKVSCAGL
jgi:hypothetical protein